MVDCCHSTLVAGHYANFSFYCGWVSLRIVVEQIQLNYIASLHGAGTDVGVMAVTTFGQLRAKELTAEEGHPPEDIQTTHDAFRFVHTESVDELDKRSGELEEILDGGLTVALSALMRRIGGPR
jgi:hypothetical protein